MTGDILDFLAPGGDDGPDLAEFVPGLDTPRGYAPLDLFGCPDCGADPAAVDVAVGITVRYGCGSVFAVPAGSEPYRVLFDWATPPEWCHAN